jgi:hypothetical protein
MDEDSGHACHPATAKQRSDLATDALRVGVPGRLRDRADQVADVPGNGCVPFSGGVVTRSVSRYPVDGGDHVQLGPAGARDLLAGDRPPGAL